MKKYLIILLSIFLFSCTDDYTYITEELEEPVDLKALKMEMVGPVFESIARQPEMAQGFINAAEAMLYKDISEILPISDSFVVERGIARGKAFSTMFESIGRQPEAIEYFEIAATKFLGKYDAEIISDEMLEYQKIYSITSLVEALARQPEAYNDMDTVCQDFFNCNLGELLKK